MKHLTRHEKKALLIPVSDANGCTSFTSITITQPSVISASASAGTIACFGSNTTVVILATGGTKTYNGTGSFSQLAITTVYTVTDAKACTAIVSVTLYPSGEVRVCLEGNK